MTSFVDFDEVILDVLVVLDDKCVLGFSTLHVLKSKTESRHDRSNVLSCIFSPESHIGYLEAQTKRKRGPNQRDFAVSSQCWPISLMMSRMLSTVCGTIEEAPSNCDMTREKWLQEKRERKASSRAEEACL